jgi:WD40 repeat protein
LIVFSSSSVGGEDNTVRAWDLHPTFIKLNNPLSTYRGHTGAVNDVAYARGGELIVSGSASAEIAVWEGRASDKRLHQFIGHSGPVLSISVSDEKIYSSSEDRTIRAWDLSTGHALLSILHGHTAPVNALALTPDGDRIVSAADDGTLRIFDAHSGEPCARPLCTSGRMFAVAVSRDGALVACSGEDMRVHVWRANTPFASAPASARQQQQQQQLQPRHRVAGAGAAVSWPDSFVRRARGLEFCVVDEQGFLADFTLPDDGWLRGSTNDPMCWIPSVYRAGLWTPRTVGILGALETILDLRSFVHGTRWEQCRVADTS